MEVRMRKSDWKSVVDTAAGAALEYFESLPERAVMPASDRALVRAALDRPPAGEGTDAAQVVAELARDLGPHVAAQSGGRYFGFVVGGLHPAAYGAEVLLTAWDQN